MFLQIFCQIVHSVLEILVSLDLLNHFPNVTIIFEIYTSVWLLIRGRIFCIATGGHEWRNMTRMVSDWLFIGWNTCCERTVAHQRNVLEGTSFDWGLNRGIVGFQNLENPSKKKMLLIYYQKKICLKKKKKKKKKKIKK